MITYKTMPVMTATPVLLTRQEIASIKIEALEKEMLSLPQASCSVVHHFGPNICIREVSIPANTFSIGHYQKKQHMNIMLKGRVLMVNDDGSTKELVAPLIFVSPPGRKVGYILEDMVWQNVYSTDETDIDKVESQFIDKSETWKANDKQQKVITQIARQADRDDYFKLLDECGISHETALAQSISESDRIDILLTKARVLPSPIDGEGVFATAPIEAGEVIGPARMYGKRTQFGRFTNHSKTPNAQMVKRQSGDIDLVAINHIKGCHGGGQGEEITIDYRAALALSGVICQQ